MSAMKHSHDDTGNNVFNKFQVDTVPVGVLDRSPNRAQLFPGIHDAFYTDGLVGALVLYSSAFLSFSFFPSIPPRPLHSPPLAVESITAFDIAAPERRAEDSSDATRWTFCASANARTSFMPFSWSIVSSSIDGKMSIISR